MFSPYQIPYFIRYFDGIDAAVSTRLSRNVPPTETTLTEEFLALMDVEAQRRENLLDFNVDDLQAGIASEGDILDITFQISAHQHSSMYEAYVSQADFGLILEYQNTVCPALNLNAAYLMQAKRLFRDKSNVYSIQSKFHSIKEKQEEKIQALAHILGHDAIKYCLYMPQTKDYDKNSTGVIRAFHSQNLSTELFDFATGLALHEAVRNVGGIDAGIWIAEVNAPRQNAAEIHKYALMKTHPLTWFMLSHFNRLSFHRADDWPLKPQNQFNESTDRIVKIATGDRSAAQELIGELGGDARAKFIDPRNMKVLPKYCVTIRVRFGPPDGLDLPISRIDRE